MINIILICTLIIDTNSSIVVYLVWSNSLQLHEGGAQGAENTLTSTTTLTPLLLSNTTNIKTETLTFPQDWMMDGRYDLFCFLCIFSFFIHPCFFDFLFQQLGFCFCSVPMASTGHPKYPTPTSTTNPLVFRNSQPTTREFSRASAPASTV